MMKQSRSARAGTTPQRLEGVPHRAHVLIVEDDRLMQEAFRLLLSGRYRLEIATSFIEAACRISDPGTHYDLLLTDFDLQSCEDGLDVALTFRHRFPVAGVLMVTGTHLGHKRIQQFRDLPRSQVLEKPCSSESLILTTETLLRKAPFAV